MKKNKMMRLASILLVAVLLSTSVISGTFAKYTSDVTVSDIARVAKWSITVENAEIGVAGNPGVAFDLFTTVNDTGNTANDEQVKDGEDGESIIAPGTAGSFAIDIANRSEVDAKYTIALTETNTGNIPLRYSVDGETWVDSVAELTMTALTDQTIAMGTGTATKTVYWKWVFDNTDQNESVHAGQTDDTDTALGYAAYSGTPATVTITATITVTQVD